MTTFSHAPVEVPLAADRDGPVSLTAQITAQLRAALASGHFMAGERLPSTRALAVSLGVSRTVVTTVYAQLFAEGWLEGRHGSGTYVATGAPGAPETPGALGVVSPLDAPGAPGAGAPGAVSAFATLVTPREPDPPEAPHAPAAVGVRAADLMITEHSRHPWPRMFRDHGVAGIAGIAAGGIAAGGIAAAGPLIDLRPGIPWTDSIDRAAWRRAWRQAGAAPISGWPDTRGLPVLRAALTSYLRRSRAVRCDPGQVLVTRGVSASLSLVAAALLRPGDRVGIEEPGYGAARSVLHARGARLVPCRVDSDGLVVAELPGDLRMIYTTPAHQYPLGGRLPVPRRQALVAWARAAGALIIEDDYDGEFRYDVAPLPALFGLDPELVVYLGTTTKTLTPALGVGWLVARPDLVAALADTGSGAGVRVPEPVQHAVLALLENGDLERHIRRMRHDYARRRAAMVSLLGGSARLRGDTAGMHMFLELPSGVDDEVAWAARARGVEVVTLRRYFSGPPARHGLVLGYGAASLGEVTRACQMLAEILAALPALGPGTSPKGRPRPR
jgi:GntR family transcriptional regulator/MocR family aminotransferase